jgi:hypothetical protein
MTSTGEWQSAMHNHWRSDRRYQKNFNIFFFLLTPEGHQLWELAGEGSSEGTTANSVASQVSEALSAMGWRQGTIRYNLRHSLNKTKGRFPH